MIERHPNQKGESLEDTSLGQIRLRIEVERSPASVVELMEAMRGQGHDAEVVSMKEAGSRPFGVIGRILVDGIDVVAKLAGEHLPEDHPEWAEAFVRQGAIEAEYEGLKAAAGLTPKLIGEIVAQGQTVGVLKQFVDGMPLAQAVRAGALSAENALLKAIELAQEINDLGYKLWDCAPENLWLRADGSVILIEGQCIIRHSQKDLNNPNRRDDSRKLVETMMQEALAN